MRISDCASHHWCVAWAVVWFTPGPSEFIRTDDNVV